MQNNASMRKKLARSQNNRGLLISYVRQTPGAEKLAWFIVIICNDFKKRMREMGAREHGSFLGDRLPGAEMLIILSHLDLADISRQLPSSENSSLLPTTSCFDPDKLEIGHDRTPLNSAVVNSDQHVLPDNV